MRWNWGVDLQAKCLRLYKLLFVVLLAGLFAVFLQLLYRHLLLYPRCILSEIAIISTDLAELIGSTGVLLPAGNVIFALALGDPLGDRPAKIFEWPMAVLVLIRLHGNHHRQIGRKIGTSIRRVCAIEDDIRIWGTIHLRGILRATVMPHSPFLGSALATQDRLTASPSKTASPDAPLYRPIPHTPDSFKDNYELEPTTHAERENNALGFVRTHLWHGIVDIALSLLGFAVIINALILVLAAAVFYYGAEADATKTGPASLFDAHTLIGDLVGKPAALLFALALLAAGQSASMIATVAGKSVSEGFLRWRVSVTGHASPRDAPDRTRPLAHHRRRRGQLGAEWASSGELSHTLHRAAIRDAAAHILHELQSENVCARARVPVLDATSGPTTDMDTEVADPNKAETAEEQDKVVDYSSGKVATGLGVVLWLTMVAANAYMLLMLPLGEDS
ncbi:hypothetical protein FIBSPDRAFT_1042393 [Athelia psychrophila]|uniref:Uncharacterized protein n=1 Tax=Athelia psychrophila TaxID=1759441 RepID=A0A166MKP3_9AGAM|nr:hypothetical protein FIBSPDRAFT_1042393 [Fibularhizoctonia sp. CBS 109695]